MTLPSSVTEAPETDSDRVSGQVTDAQIDAIYRGLVEAGVSLSFPSTVSPASAMRAALRATPSLPPRSGGVVEGVRQEAAFLLARLDDLEWSGEIDEVYLDFARHVAPSAARLRMILSTLADPIPEAPTDEEVEGLSLEKAVRDAHKTLMNTLDRDFGLWSSPAFAKAREAVYPLWKRLDETLAALRRSTETDKPGVREAALEEAAKVAASFGDPVCNPFTFTRHAHAQEVATAIRALSASPAPEEQVTDVEADRRERALKVDPDKHGHRTRFSDSSYFDEVCIMCGATDGFGDKRLDQPCPKPLPRSTTGGAK